MAKNLVIVESPAKAKTIEKFLGQDFEVRASMGHIMDLPPKGLGVDVRHDFHPNYEIIERKEALIKDLKSASKRADTVYLAPDPDREGEFIAWSLKETLGLRAPKRAVFNEITRRAVQDAIRNPREIDEDLFNAQQARRVLDRLVGYKISPLLWRRVQSNTSAGRVQSVALRLICDREAEVRAFVPEEYWTITAWLVKGQGKPFPAQLIARTGDADASSAPSEDDDESAPARDQDHEALERALKLKITNEADAKAIVAQLAGAPYRVARIVQRDVRRQPYPPYTTSTLQQDASVRLRFKPKRTMSLAQELYEGIALGDDGHQGLVTYIRTDSTRISSEAQVAVKDYIRGRFGPEYVGAGPMGRQKATTQDAHEAIRPTDPNLTPDDVKRFLTTDQFKLYQLIWRRFVASFMAPAVLDTLRVDIAAREYLFRAGGSTVKFPGFYAIWPREEEEDTLPPLAVGDALNLQKLDPRQHFTQPPPRYSEASLIKELEERGIGRPSTYVPILSTIQDRGYVEQQERRFVPTWLGETVNELMIKHFAEIVDVNFTAAMEVRLDDVEEGKREWTSFLHEFYARLREALSVAEKEMDKVQKPTEELGEACPECGRPLLIRMGRFGRFISCSGFNDKENQCVYKRSIVNKTGAICPQCGGDLVERKSKGRGKIFFGCANYPTCTFAVWNRPLAVPCPECGGLLTQANGAKESVCYQCAATVEGIAEGHPVVTGHRPVAEVNQPKRERQPSSGARTTRSRSAAAATTGTGQGTTTVRRTRSAAATQANGATKTTTRAPTRRASTTGRKNTTTKTTTRKTTAGKTTTARRTTKSKPQPTGAEA